MEHLPDINLINSSTYPLKELAKNCRSVHLWPFFCLCDFRRHFDERKKQLANHSQLHRKPKLAASFGSDEYHLLIVLCNQEVDNCVEY